LVQGSSAVVELIERRDFLIGCFGESANVMAGL
jgi:hypothetical protein